MSAWIVSKTHVAAIVRFAMRNTYTQATIRDLGYENAATMLYAENVTSVNHRYADQTPDEPVAFTYREIDRAPDLSPVECIKAVDCLEYQSCEHPGWKESRARKLLDAIRGAAISKLPGYKAAPWGIDDEPARKEA